MDYYDANLKNPKVLGKSLIVDGEINKDIGISPSKIIGGEGIKISRENGKIIISLNRSSSNGNSPRNNDNSQ